MLKKTNDLAFSSNAASVRYLFYKDLNDINIFVEDFDCEYEYETIFNRLLGKKYTIKTVFSSGGKLGVISNFREFGDRNFDNPKIKNFYIVDGDFDKYVFPSEMISHKHFIYLGMYNIENYLIDYNATIEFAKGKLRCLDDEVVSKVDFDKWRKKIVNQSKELFLIYCFLVKFHPEIQNVSRPHGLFLDQRNGFQLQDDSFDKYISEIKEKDELLEQRIVEIRDLYVRHNGEDFFGFICGKFLLTSLGWHLRNVTRAKFKHDDFRWYLIQRFEIEALEFIKERIEECLN